MKAVTGAEDRQLPSLSFIYRRDSPIARVDNFTPVHCLGWSVGIAKAQCSLGAVVKMKLESAAVILLSSSAITRRGSKKYFQLVNANKSAYTSMLNRRSMAFGASGQSIR